MHGSPNFLLQKIINYFKIVFELFGDRVKFLRLSIKLDTIYLIPNQLFYSWKFIIVFWQRGSSKGSTEITHATFSWAWKVRFVYFSSRVVQPKKNTRTSPLLANIQFFYVQDCLRSICYLKTYFSQTFRIIDRTFMLLHLILQHSWLQKWTV